MLCINTRLYGSVCSCGVEQADSSRAANMAAPIARSKCFMGTPSQTPRHTPEPIVVNILPRVFWKINRFFQDFLL